MLTRSPVWRVVVALLVLSVLLALLYGGVRGYYSWDYFTLWGTHAKWVWATGRFFLPGSELPIPFPYQSVLGSVVGSLSRLVWPEEYPDSLFGLANVMLVTTLWALACWQATHAWRHDREQGFILGVIALGLIRPVEWSQITWGGYQDLSAALALALGVLALLDGRLRHYVGWALVGLALRPVNWPWWILAGGIWSLREIPRDLISRRSLWALSVPVGAFLVIKLAYHSTFLHPMLSTHPSDYSLAERLLIPWGILKTQTGALALLLALAIHKRREGLQLGLFLVAAFAYLVLIYTFVMGRTGTETYASIHRYTLPVYLVSVFACLRGSELEFNRQPRLRVLSLGLLCLVGFVRALEDVPRVSREGGIAALASFPNRYPDALAQAAAMRDAAQALPPTCTTYLWDADAQLDQLRAAYTAVPLRIYFRESLSAEGNEKRCPLDPGVR